MASSQELYEESISSSQELELCVDVPMQPDDADLHYVKEMRTAIARTTGEQLDDKRVASRLELYRPASACVFFASLPCPWPWCRHRCTQELVRA